MLKLRGMLGLFAAFLAALTACSSDDSDSAALYWDCYDTTSGELAGQCHCEESSQKPSSGATERCERTDYKCCVEWRTEANHGYPASHDCFCTKADDPRDCDTLLADQSAAADVVAGSAALVASCPP